MNLTAYKFLAKGGIGPISGFRWPLPRGAEPGAWVEVEGPLGLCTRGIHLCGPFDLAHWLHDELWEVARDGDAIEGVDCVIVRRARLVRRFDSWSEGGASRFAEACIEHATSLSVPDANDVVRGFLDDARLANDAGYAAVSAFAAALAAANSTAMQDAERAYRSERRWQAAWITREIIAP